MQFKCPHCESILASDDVTIGMDIKCPECKRNFVVEPYVRTPKLTVISSPSSNDHKNGEFVDVIHEKVISHFGIEKLKGFSLKELFSEAFSKHSREEVEESFSMGTKKSTPDILEIDASWPKPWLFMRMLIASLVLYFLFWVGYNSFQNPNLIPGWILIGSFAVPISVLVLFIEMNIRRNVSIYMIARLVFLGGILSLLFSLLSSNFFDNGWWGASSAGPIEETGKVLAMLAVARSAQYKYKLNGLLIGASVGVGFAAFETAGYALRFLALDGIDTMEEVLIMRGFLSPLAHIVWSAIAGFAMWRTIKGRNFHWRMLVDVDFIRLLLIPVILHMLWNTPISLPFFAKEIILGVISWFICFSLIQEGIREIQIEQEEERIRRGEVAKNETEEQC